MNEKILIGSKVSEQIDNDTLERVKKLKDNNITPHLKVVRVGDEKSDIIYENSIKKKFTNLGITVGITTFQKNVQQKELEDTFININENTNVHGVLLLRPLPEHIDEDKLRIIIDPKKDVDCMSHTNLAKVFAGKKNCFAPCTAESVIELIKKNNIEVKGKNIAIVGRSMVVGRPLAMLLMKKDATVTICHRKTKGLSDICKRQDIVIVAVRDKKSADKKLIDKNYVTENTILIDTSVNMDKNGKICGHIEYDELKDYVAKITPVPNGIGIITTSVLARHVVISAEFSSKY